MSKLQVDDIVNKEDNGSVGFSRGAVVTGVITATSFSGALTGGASGDFSIADKIVHTGDTDTAIRFPANDTFTVETGGAENARFTSSAIIFKAPDGGSRYNFGELGNSAHAELSLYNSSDAQKVRIAANNDTFFDGGDVSIGSQSPLNGAQLTVAGKGIAITGQNTDHSANSMRLGEEGSGLAQIRCYGPDSSTNGSLTLRSSRDGGQNNLDVSLLANGNLSISDGNLVVASGHGIDFSATGTGSGTDTSELLDDYEEGTWTPNVGGNTTYTSQSGSYTKIGRSVTARFQFTINVLGTGSNQRIENLPFAVAGSNVGECAGPVSYFANLHTARGSLTCYAGSGTNRVYFNSITGDAAAMGINQVVFQNSTVMWGTVTYFTN